MVQDEFDARSKELQEMKAWGYTDIAELDDLVAAIDKATGNKKWDEALSELMQLRTNFGPIWGAFIAQRDARVEYDTLIVDFNKRLDYARSSNFRDADIGLRLE